MCITGGSAICLKHIPSFQKPPGRSGFNSLYDRRKNLEHLRSVLLLCKKTKSSKTYIKSKLNSIFYLYSI